MPASVGTTMGNGDAGNTAAVRTTRANGARASAPATPTVEAHVAILDASTGKVIKGFPPVAAAPYEKPGSATVAVAFNVPVAQLPKGAYRLEVQATDSAGRKTVVRTANFSVE
jgi:type IV secretory pathway TrbL component